MTLLDEELKEIKYLQPTERSEEEQVAYKQGLKNKFNSRF